MQSRIFVVGALLLVGCRSLDPGDDVATSAALVAERTGIEEVWSATAASSSADLALSADAPPLSLYDATRLALRRHPEIRRELERIAEARADLVQAGLLPNPMISVSPGIPIDGMSGTPAMASLLQSLAALWQRPARVDAADAALRARVLRLSDIALRHVADVRTAFADVANGGREVEWAESLVAVRGEQLALLVALRDVGEADDRQVNAARLAWAQAEDERLRSRERWETDRRRLSERIGVPFDDARRFADLEAPHGVPGEDALLEWTTERRLDVAAAFVAVGGASARSRLASLRRVPEFQAGVNYMRNFQDRDGLFPTIGLTLPILDTGAAAVAKAKAIERGTAREADAILWQALHEVRLAHVAWSSAEARLERFEAEWLPAARENVAIAEAAFESGELTRVELLEDEARLAAVEKRRTEVERLAARAYFELERAVGGRLSP